MSGISRSKTESLGHGGPTPLFGGGRVAAAGRIETLIDYHSYQEPQNHLELLERCGFKTLVTNARGWTMG